MPTIGERPSDVVRVSSKPTHNYATLSTPGTKKISVCARRVGSRERMGVIAVCTNETDAEKIVDGLNLLQGEMTRLEAPAQRTLVDVRNSLEKQFALTTEMRNKVRELESQLREQQYKESRIARDLASETVRANRAEEALKAAMPVKISA